jgi:preprotein translocase subunit SecF
MEPREGRESRESDAVGHPSRRSQLVALLVAVVAAAILITLLFQVTFLQPILATPLAFADLLAIVLGASYVITFRLVARRRSNGRAS